jgi:hypothetical protein
LAFLLLAAQRFFIISESRLLPAGVIPPRRALELPPFPALFPPDDWQIACLEGSYRLTPPIPLLFELRDDPLYIQNWSSMVVSLFENHTCPRLFHERVLRRKVPSSAIDLTPPLAVRVALFNLRLNTWFGSDRHEGLTSRLCRQD